MLHLQKITHKKVYKNIKITEKLETIVIMLVNKEGRHKVFAI